MEQDIPSRRISETSEEPLLDQPTKANLPAKIKLDTLTQLQVIGYSVGHFQNDLCAACWFNYLLYFMKNVVFSNDPNSGFYAGYPSLLCFRNILE